MFDISLMSEWMNKIKVTLHLRGCCCSLPLPTLPILGSDKSIKVRNEVGDKASGWLKNSKPQLMIELKLHTYSIITELVRTSLYTCLILKVGWRDPLVLSMAVLSNKLLIIDWYVNYSYFNTSLAWDPNIHCPLVLSQQYM